METTNIPATKPATKIEMSNRAQRKAWCFYDFANSAFPTVIITAVYVIYFKDVVVGETEQGYSDYLWGWANSIGAAIVFLSAPFLGAIADLAGKKKQFLIGYTTLCILATGLLCFTGEGTVVLAMVLFILALVGFEGSCVFYNAFLPLLVPKDQMEKLSGAGWALGYIGGLGCLLITLSIAIFAKEFIYLVPLVVAVWFTVFAIPSLKLLKDNPPIMQTDGISSLMILGAKRFSSTFSQMKKHRELVKFLISYFFYNNAVVTIIVFSVAFSNDSLNFSMIESIILVVVMNIIAAPGAYVFGIVANKLGSKQTIIITLFMWLVVIVGAELSVWPDLFTAQEAKNCFWGVSALASLCIGAIQATSRTLVGQMAPKGRSGEFFGFMAFAGKGSAVVGPAVFGVVSATFESQRAAVFSIGCFFLIGLLVLFFVKTSVKMVDEKA